MNFQNIETTKIILGSIEFKKSLQGGFNLIETAICKYDYEATNKSQQKIIFSKILKSLDCEPTTAIIRKIIKDISKNGVCIFQQEKKGLKLHLLKTYSLKFETTTVKQFQLEL